MRGKGKTEKQVKKKAWGLKAEKYSKVPLGLWKINDSLMKKREKNVIDRVEWTKESTWHDRMKVVDSCWFKSYCLSLCAMWLYGRLPEEYGSVWVSKGQDWEKVCLCMWLWWTKGKFWRAYESWSAYIYTKYAEYKPLQMWTVHPLIKSAWIYKSCSNKKQTVTIGCQAPERRNSKMRANIVWFFWNHTLAFKQSFNDAHWWHNLLFIQTQTFSKENNFSWLKMPFVGSFLSKKVNTVPLLKHCSVCLWILARLNHCSDFGI